MPDGLVRFCPSSFRSLIESLDIVSCESVLSVATWLRGYFYLKIDDVEMAMNDLNVCIKLEQQEAPMAHHFLAKCLMKEGKWYESIVENTRAIEAVPHLIGAFKDRATANRVVGRIEDAESDTRMFSMLMSKKAVENKLPPKE